MSIEESRYRALDIALRLNPTAKQFSDVAASADEILAYLTANRPTAPVPKPLIHNWNQQSIEQLTRCINDPLEYARLCTIPHLTKGPIAFDPYPFQEVLIREIHQRPRVIVNSSRQMGVSTIEAMYALWFAAMNRDRTVVIACNRLVGAHDIMERIRFANAGLPAHMRTPVVASNKGMIEFENGSRIFARALSANACRGMGVSLLILDEFAYAPHSVAREFWNSTYPVLAANPFTKILIASTPGVPAGPFFEIWTGALDGLDFTTGEGKNGFCPITLNYKAHPRRDAEWVDSYRNALGEKKFAQEFENQFVTV